MNIWHTLLVFMISIIHADDATKIDKFDNEKFNTCYTALTVDEDVTSAQ